MLIPATVRVESLSKPFPAVFNAAIASPLKERKVAIKKIASATAGVYIGLNERKVARKNSRALPLGATPIDVDLLFLEVPGPGPPLCIHKLGKIWLLLQRHSGGFLAAFQRHCVMRVHG